MKMVYVTKPNVIFTVNIDIHCIMGHKVSWVFFYEHPCFSLVGRYTFVRKEVDMESRLSISAFLPRSNKTFNSLYNNCDLEIYGRAKISVILFLSDSFRSIRLSSLRRSRCMSLGRTPSHSKPGTVSMGASKDREREPYLYTVIISIPYGSASTRI